MLRSVVLVGIGLGAQAYAPIQMMSHGSKGLAVLPRVSPRNVQASAMPQQLAISNAAESISPNRIPYFSAGPDNTITWDDMEWCLEADGDQRGAIARVNKCNGEAVQKWNWIPNGHGNYRLQLQDSRMCLDVRDGSGLDGAPIELRDCEHSVTETWAFEDPVAEISVSFTHSSEIQHVMFSLFALAGVGVLGVSAWLKRWQAKAHTAAISHRDPGGGVALTAPMGNAIFSMSAVLDRPQVSTPSTRRANISMALTLDPEETVAADDAAVDSDVRQELELNKVAGVPEGEETTLSVPFFTQAGLQQLNQINEEENAKRRERLENNSEPGTFNAIRNALIAPLPGFIRRGFTSAWAPDELAKAPAKKTAPPTVSISEDMEAWGPLRAFAPSTPELFADTSSVPLKAVTAPLWTKTGLMQWLSDEYDPFPSKPEPAEPRPPILTKGGVAYVQNYGIDEYEAAADAEDQMD